MDGKGRWVDNVFIERLWRSVKYEEVYLHAYETPKQASEALIALLRFLQRPATSSIARPTYPDTVYFASTW